MNEKYRKIIARGICTFGAAIDRDRDGYASIVAATPSESCEKVCDYCWHMADHILKGIKDANFNDIKDIDICRQKKTS